MTFAYRELTVDNMTFVKRDKVKMFAKDCYSEGYFYSLEQDINEWMKQHPNVLIQSIEYRQSCSVSGSVTCSVLIYYREEYVKHETQQD